MQISLFYNTNEEIRTRGIDKIIDEIIENRDKK